MPKQIFVNLPVTDLEKSTAFYEALGFTKNPSFSDENASSMMWSEEITVMLLKHDFYKGFLRDKEIADTQKTSGALMALSFDTQAEVEEFAKNAEANGGTSYQIETGVPKDLMLGFEVIDPDGHHWEPVWMAPSFDPQAATES